MKRVLTDIMTVVGIICLMVLILAVAGVFGGKG